MLSYMMLEDQGKTEEFFAKSYEPYVREPYHVRKQFILKLICMPHPHCLRQLGLVKCKRSLSPYFP